jgi:GT2 family glycosyltransferase
MMTRSSIEVLFVLHHNDETIESAISSVQHIGPGVSVAFHDNSPSGESLPAALEAATRHGFPARGVVCESNCGFGRGCNALASGSSADWLLFLNPDTQILRWPANLPELNDRTILGPRVLTQRGNAAITWGRQPVLLAEAARRLPLLGRAALPWMARQPQSRRGIDYLSGVALLVSSRVFREVGGFDPRFFMYYEDVDFTLRAKSRGCEVRVHPDWLISHLGGHSSAGDPAGVLVRTYDSGRAFFWKHGGSTTFEALCTVDLRIRQLAALTLREQEQRETYRSLAAHIRASRRSPARPTEPVSGEPFRV